MKTTLVSLLIVALCAMSSFAITTQDFEEIKAEIEAEYIPNLVIAVTDDIADDLRVGRSIPEELSNLYPTAVYEPLCTVPVRPEHEQLWHEHGLHRWFIIRNVETGSARSTLQNLEALESVEIAEFSSLHFADLTPMDDGNYNVWAMDNMQAYEAWEHQVGRDEVVVTTLDTGCELLHPDLQHNIHINPGEDLNSNGRWDASDVNGVDDDGNGYVDDIAGWDFVSGSVSGLFSVAGEDYGPRDNRVWPDIVGHGTHTSGTAASSTNNSLGVPSASWNVTNMPLRTGYAIRFLFIILGAGDTVDFIAATQYAAENGTDIISISFGGTGYSQSYQDMINFARSLGVLTIASAGNSNNQVVNYPAGYNSVISVAATTVNDTKASFSTYGAWVDISAPGVNIWSTVPGGSYASYDGTSMSSPNVAAVAALVKSHNSSMTPGELETYLLDGCDSIDDENPGYIGMLGAGRVNANNSLMLARAAYPPALGPNVDIIPLVSPTIVSASGGSFAYNYVMMNSSATTQVFDITTEALLPDGNVYGPIFSQNGFSLSANSLTQGTLQLQVPASAPAGTYRFAAILEDVNSTYTEVDYLHFVKVEGAVADVNGGWSGQSFAVASGNDSDPSSLPTDYAVGTAFPNPFNAMTTVSIHLPQTSDLKVEVFDVNGRLVATVMNGSLTAGTHDVSINAESFASGMYFLRAISVQGQLDHTQKIMLVK